MSNEDIVSDVSSLNESISIRVMMLSMKGLSLLTKSLEMTLYITLHRLIGLKCIT